MFSQSVVLVKFVEDHIGLDAFVEDRIQDGIVYVLTNYYVDF
ncbi:hypothetical protein QY97_02464 [Bacillus thermotolerans]|nr:hypothetical protein QY97_02464 [Bacillus thermotolerans]